jgi:hypothetical protein
VERRSSGYAIFSGHSFNPCSTVGEATCGSGPPLRRFYLAGPPRSRSNQRMHKFVRSPGYLIDRAGKDRLIGFRRRIKSAKLANELNRARSDLVLRRRGREVVKGSDVSAHGTRMMPPKWSEIKRA